MHGGLRKKWIEIERASGRRGKYLTRDFASLRTRGDGMYVHTEIHRYIQQVLLCDLF